MKKALLVLMAATSGFAFAQNSIEGSILGTTPAEIEAKANVIISKSVAADTDASKIRTGNNRMWPSVEACYSAVNAAAADGGCAELKQSISCLQSNIFSNKYNLSAFYKLADAILAKNGATCAASSGLAALKAQKQSLPLVQMEQPGNPDKIYLIPVAYTLGVVDVSGRASTQYTVRDLKPLKLKFYTNGTAGDSISIDAIQAFGLGVAKSTDGREWRTSFAKNAYPIQAEVPGSLVGSNRPNETVRLSAIVGAFVSPAQNKIMEIGVELDGDSLSGARFSIVNKEGEEDFARYIQRANLEWIKR
jgi:hypothetical protein